MSMTETPAPAAKPKRKRAHKAAAPPPKAPSIFAGLTATDCCDGCNEKKCVISGMNVCAHPMKGGLQSAMLSNPEVMKRHGAAKRMLAHAKIDLGGA